MNSDAFNTFCGSLPASTHVVQWNGSDVWKVGGKVFAIGSWGGDKYAGITFKVSEFAYQVLRDAPGYRPAPYMASRGLTWIQYHAGSDANDHNLRRDLSESHRLVAAGLSRKRQRELGLIGD